MTHPVDKHVGGRIRYRRWMTGTTQKQLGDAVGIKFQQIQKYETGKNRVSASRLYDIARVLEVPVSFFFEGLSGEGETALPQNSAAELFSGREALELVRCFYDWPAEQRQRLFELTKAFKKQAA